MRNTRSPDIPRIHHMDTLQSPSVQYVYIPSLLCRRQPRGQIPGKYKIHLPLPSDDASRNRYVPHKSTPVHDCDPRFLCPSSTYCLSTSNLRYPQFWKRYLVLLPHNLQMDLPCINTLLLVSECRTYTASLLLLPAQNSHKFQEVRVASSDWLFDPTD